MTPRIIPIEGLDTLPREEALRLRVAQQTLELVLGSAVRDSEQTVDPDLAVEGILMGLACIMEQAPEFPTRQSLRKGGEAYGKMLGQQAQNLRSTFEETGMHPIDALLDRFMSVADDGQKPN
ncbi:MULTISPECIES: hypothetical protein [Sphingobium]|uniref:Uncharacterized protein n=1 Tax=Sphingobium fuliginis (strain ATCC 27551) TaxID=336203 RepID=A0A292ZND9_SPHSA|nr:MULTISPECIES: hypothetical protein [Sphingobium]OAP29972.1 hypothetical protein A8O16_20875 [Sphingobium sp. 20006FA]KXU29834.1 hypothetical protein AXW74_20905 [Sphingobium sp. AM]KYC30381.1 hypothetical protein A0J57_20900 [Sphingobium sp. 22B]MCB4859045.1 hypothetical protein [Sphingobium sp. PNB]MEC6701360.1 hypothetical protein [Sphingobium sp. SJ10-10]